MDPQRLSPFDAYGGENSGMGMVDVNLTYNIAKDEPIVRILICLLYALIFFVGIAGNTLVVFVVLRTKSMRTITNLFITNLATSDILMGLVATPFTPIVLYMKSWDLPAALCKLLPITMGVSVYVSTLTSTAIAVDRFFVIVHPFVPRMKTWLCLLIILTVWAIALLISMPLAVYQRKHVDTRMNVSSCHENWPKESSREVFTIVSFVLQFVVPCSIISVCYLRVSLTLRSRWKTKIGSGLKSRHREEHDIRRKRRTNTMLIAMVVIFVICWIPLNVLWMVIDVVSGSKHYDFRQSKSFLLIFFICHLLAMSSAVYNPFLYAWMNENFKKEFHRILPCLFRSSSYTNGRANSATLAAEWSTSYPPERSYNLTVRSGSFMADTSTAVCKFRHSYGAQRNSLDVNISPERPITASKSESSLHRESPEKVVCGHVNVEAPAELSPLTEGSTVDENVCVTLSSSTSATSVASPNKINSNPRKQCSFDKLNNIVHHE